MKNINRRESLRIDIQLRCHISSPPVWSHCAMHTENISRNGLLIAWEDGDPSLRLPSTGQILTLDIELPAHHGFGPRCIHCQGTVTRIWQSEFDFPRIALQINYMDFRSLQDRLRSLDTIVPAANNWMG